MTGFSNKDIEQLNFKGISREKVAQQIRTFKEGIPFVLLDKPAVIGDGIQKFSPTRENQLIAHFDKEKDRFKLLKFVPASGAASRMFKHLFEFMHSFHPQKKDLETYLAREENKLMSLFFNGLRKFPFYEMINERIKDLPDDKDQQALAFVEEMLDEDKLHFDFYPKGLLPFHNYEGHLVTAFEEHLKEGANYACSGKVARLHFTISEQHETMFHKQYEEIKDRLTKSTGVEFIVNFSQQKSSTDTLAVTEENTPFREKDGTLFFRPGGHGALIENLNDQDADIIFVKNIDNVVVDSFLEDVTSSKKVLAGLLMKIQDKAFKYAEMLERNDIELDQLKEIQVFLSEELNVRFSDNFSFFSLAEQIEILKDKINRPIRICGMVKNEGEPGGGPFWLRDIHGHVSLQIVESAQVNMDLDSQAEIFKSATHFNPVDIVCGIKNYKGDKYNLLNFVDTKQGFISQKTKDGKILKALELPGLWNGAMSFWNTVFVEVPLLTFNPVKSVNDLLRAQHQTA